MENITLKTKVANTHTKEYLKITFEAKIHSLPAQNALMKCAQIKL